jgi:hypothetical protein
MRHRSASTGSQSDAAGCGEPRLRLWPYEAAAVLQRSTDQISVMIKRRELRRVGHTSLSQLDPGEVVAKAEELFSRGQLAPLGPYLAARLRSGHLAPPRPRTPKTRPPSLLVLLDQLLAMPSSGPALRGENAA